MNTCIVCIAKLESDYILNFIKYHLHIGFNKIYIYDNEDIPVYEKLLSDYSESVVVIHLPGNNYRCPVQYFALEHFISYFMDQFTHVAHIDIDEYIVLKKHSSIGDFIKDHFTGDCGAIGMNWRFFGSNGHSTKSDVPEVIRFTRCELKGNVHIKTLFATEFFVKYNQSPHAVTLKENYKTKSTKGQIINGPFNTHIDFSVIQLNHYKCKTLPEFKYIRSRGRSDCPKNNQPRENIIKSFKVYDLNEIEELTAYSRCVEYSAH